MVLKVGGGGTKLLGRRKNFKLFAADIPGSEKPGTAKMFEKKLWKSDILNEDAGH